MSTLSLNPQTSYVTLAGDGAAACLSGGDAFWSLPEAALDRLAAGWLIAEFECAADWPQWEMHPNGDEFVYLLAGAVDMLLEQADGIETVALRGSAAVLVPRGVWHTAKVLAPSRMLHVTMGKGTQHREVTP